MNILELLQSSGIEPEKASRSEYHSACPECGGSDRFSCWPEKANSNGLYMGGRYVCRGCGINGDAVNYLIRKHGIGYRDACRQLDVSPGSYERPVIRQWQPKATMSEPAEIWREKAKDVMLSCQKTLFENSEVMAWLQAERGLNPGTVQKYGLGWNDKDLYEIRSSWGLPDELNHKTGKAKKIWIPSGLIIPCFDADGRVIRIRVRRNAQDCDSRYVVVTGSNMRAMAFWQEQLAVAIVESELDGILLSQEAGDFIGIIALGSAQSKPDSQLHKRFMQAETVLVCLDNDKAGMDSTWRFWSKYKQFVCWPTITGKDVTEMMNAGVSIREWVKAGLPEKPVVLPVIRKPDIEINHEWVTHCDYLQLLSRKPELFDDIQERMAIQIHDGQLSEIDAEQSAVNIFSQ